MTDTILDPRKSLCLPAALQPSSKAISNVVRLKKGRHKLPEYGYAYLAGDYPTGIVKVDGVPGEADLKAVVRSDDPQLDGLVVGRTTSQHTGDWRIEGLNPKLRYDVIARHDGYNDVIATDIKPINIPRFLTKTLDVFVAQELDFVLPVIGGYGDVSISVASGSWPSGVTYSNGKISGAWPTGATGSYPVVFDLTDDEGIVQDTFTVELKLLPLKLTGEVPEHLALGEEIEPIQFVASGGEGPYTFTVSSGTLPSGLSLSSAGLLTGEPDDDDEYEFEVQVEGVRGGKISATFNTSISAAAIAWRLKITANNGDANYVSANEIEMRTSSGGANLCSGGTAFANEEYSGRGAANAFDGVTVEPGWLSTSAALPKYIGYIFSSGVIVNEVKLYGRSLSVSLAQIPKNFTIQCSNDTTTGLDGTWTDVWNVTGATGWSVNESRVFTRT